jgi:ligand-binding sensor domain-containing protein
MRVPGLRKTTILGGSLFFVLATAAVAYSEWLPIKTYTTAGGLAFDRVNKIMRDSRKYLWFCTDEGLSRFDGYGFISYTKQDGLPHQHVNDMVTPGHLR